MPEATETRPTLRRRIVEAADSVIREHGLAGATTREIAREAGCSEGSIYVHFEDKIDLVIAVVREREPHYAAVVTLAERAGGGTVEENLAGWAGEVLELLRDNLPIFVAVLADPAVFQRFVQRLHERGAGIFAVAGAAAAYVRAEQELGRVRPDVEPGVVATMLVGACRDQAIRELLPVAAEPSGGGFTKELAAAVVRGVQPERRPRRRSP